MATPLERVERYYPRSFLKLLLLAFAVVAAPLMFAFLYATVQLDRLAELSRSAVSQAAGAARETRRLVDEVTGLERLARQYLVLGDAVLLDDYALLHKRFKESTSRLALLPLDEGQLLSLNRTVDAEQILSDLLPATRRSAEGRTRLITGYVELSDHAAQMLAEGNAVIDREVERLRDTAARSERILWWLLALAVPLGLLLAVLSALAVGRPVRQIDAAIRRLGGGDLTAPVDVGGPEDLRHLGERLDWLRSRLSELEQQKQRFLRHVSHELKTPLTAIREGAELLADGTSGVLTPGQQEIAAILRAKSSELQRMIEALIDYQRAQMELSRVVHMPLRLDAVVREAIESHRLVAEARGLQIDARLDPVEIVADAGKLRVIADNLLSNAVKYSPEAGVISVVTRNDGADALLEVSDIGPGIPAEDEERIFDWFFRGEGGHGGRVSGSGLGLAIARELAIAHRGRLDLVDDGGRGARFRLSLPLGERSGAPE